MTDSKSTTKSVLAREKNGQFQLTITIPKEEIQKEFQKYLLEASKDVEVAGFRKGHAPLDKVAEKVDKQKIYEHALQHLLPRVYFEAIREHNLKPIMDPQIQLISNKEGEDWQVRTIAAEKTEVKLEDYQRKLKGLLKKQASKADKNKGNTEKQNNQKSQKDDIKSDPEQIRQQHAATISHWLLSNIEAEPAEVMVQQQANALLSQLLEQINKLGVTLDQYLASTKKKVEDLRAEQAQRARQELKLELIMMAIGEDQKIKVSEDEIKQLVDKSPDEKTKGLMDDPRQRRFLENALYRQKIVDWLMRAAA